jgi:diaminopimelate epimerase
MKFTKMHGLGNDYVYVNCFEETVSDPAELARMMCDRHTGVGGDGLILIGPSDTADARMRIFNADGSEAEMCGNGLRCVAKYTYEHQLAPAGAPFSIPGQDTVAFNASLKIQTGNGVLTVGLSTGPSNQVVQICVNMGVPILTPDDIPVLLTSETAINESIEVNGQTMKMTCVSMGNPHAVLFVDQVDQIDLAGLGVKIETHDLFPNRINVHFVEVLSPTELKMRTWERGSGITMACGTGACACGVAAVLNDKGARTCTTHLPGGDLVLNWNDIDDHVYMTGPAVEVFTGNWPG